MKKKHYLIIACIGLLAAAIFSACDKDDDDKGGDNSGNPILGKTGTVTITIENGANYSDLIDEVRLIYGDMTTIASASYNNGSFTIDLPASVADKYLDVVGEEFSAGITISNPSVKIASAWLTAYQSGKWEGDFYHGTAECKGMLNYVTGDLSITGTNSDGTLNMHLKKGWNLVYEKHTETTEEETTNAPAGARWYYK
jgi:hypothetical protein